MVSLGEFLSVNFISSNIQEIFEETHDESIQLSITSTYLSGYSERDRLIRIEKGNEWICTITRQQSVIASQKNMSQQQLEDPCNLSADVYSALDALNP